MCLFALPVSCLLKKQHSKHSVCLSGSLFEHTGGFLRIRQTKQCLSTKRKYNSSLSNILTPTSISAAMRSGTGASVVNGRWAVDPPGQYQAGGATFTYTRPRAQSEGEEEKGESLRAPGPTTTQLQLYVSAGAQESLYFSRENKNKVNTAAKWSGSKQNDSIWNYRLWSSVST